MTTIAYKDGIVAVDSRMTQNGIIINDDFNKIIVREGATFAFSGHPVDFELAIEAFLSNYKTENLIIGGIVFYLGDVYIIGCDEEEGFWKEKFDANTPYASGSGKTYALTAMDMGASAKEAVKMAIKRDVYSGGKIKTAKL